jgi:hypothetical protein
MVYGTQKTKGFMGVITQLITEGAPQCNII